MKHYETRSWKTNYRGTLVIHASKRWQDDQIRALERLIERFKLSTLYGSLWWQLGHNPLLFGSALGTVELTGVYQTEYIRVGSIEREWGDYSYGRFAWKLENAQLFPEPIPMRGQQGLWDWRGALPTMIIPPPKEEGQ